MKTGYKHMKCGLLGEHLGHSFSPLIHGELADYSYDLYEIEKEDLATFMSSGKLDAFNVTIPYKQAVIPYLDTVSPEAAAIGAVNTVVKKKDGKLFGYNTDYFGFDFTVTRSNIDISGKKVLIFGRGGAALTVSAVMRDKNAREIIMLGSADNTQENIAKHTDAEIIVNATPIGMYPKNGVSPTDLSLFPSCIAVFDLIFNPARTDLLIQAESRNIASVNGLSMLVAQAAKAFEYFTEDSFESNCIDRIISNIEKATSNIILVGMPGCGKSTVGKEIAKRLDREFIDADEAFEQMHKISPAKCIEAFGEEHFRELETQTLSELGKRSGIVLATGGGAVTKERNYPLLHQNGDIFFVERELSALAKESRPLSQRTSAEAMYAARIGYYNRFADCTVYNNVSVEDTADTIISEFEKIHDK